MTSGTTNGWSKLKVAIILSALPDGEYREYERLASRQHRSAQDEERLTFLRRRANVLHRYRPNGTTGISDDDLASLPVEDQVEYVDLSRREHRSTEDQQRLRELRRSANPPHRDPGD